MTKKADNRFVVFALAGAWTLLVLGLFAAALLWLFGYAEYLEQ